MHIVELSLFVDRVSSEFVISDDVSSVLELVVVLVSGELGEDSCNISSCTGTLCSTSMVVCSWLIAVWCASIWLRLVVVAKVVLVMVLLEEICGVVLVLVLVLIVFKCFFFI